MKREITYEDYAKKLTGDYKDAYDKIFVYIKSALSIGDEISPAMNEVVDLLLAAQEDERPVEDVIGNDMESFCEGMVKSNRKSFVYRTLLFMSLYVFIAVLVGGAQICILLYHVFTDEPGAQNPLFTGVDFVGFLSGMLVVFVILGILDFVVKSLVMKIKGFNKKVYSAIYWVAIVGIGILNVYLISIADFEITIPRIFVIIFCILYAAGVTIFAKIYRRKYMPQEEEVPTVEIDFADDLFNEIITVMRKRYQKKMEKRAKKGLPELEPLVWYEKEMKKEKIAGIFTNLFLIIIIATAVISVAEDSEVIDTMIFVIILLALEIPIMHAMNSGTRKRKELYRIMKEKNVDFMSDELYRKVE